MTLIVENGTGLSTAESYISVADATTYFTKRGNETWADVDDKEGALVRATDFMLNMYRLRWKGSRISQTQALDWPRLYVEKPIGEPLYGLPVYYDSDEIPTEVKQACAELALRASTADLAADIEPDAFTSSVRVGSIAVTYKDDAPTSTIYRAIEAKLAPLFVGNSNSARLVRT